MTRKVENNQYWTVQLTDKDELFKGEQYMLQLNDGKVIVVELLKVTIKGIETKVIDRTDSKCHVGDRIVAQLWQFKSQIFGIQQF